MKCDKLEAEQWLDYRGDPSPCYPQKEVDSAIDELKMEHHRERDEYIDWVNKLQRENSELKAMVTTDNSAVIARLEDSLRNTQRALWLARAMMADYAAHWTVYVTYMHYHENSFYAFDGDDIFHRHNKNLDGFKLWCYKWETVKGKCLKKAEEYK